MARSTLTGAARVLRNLSALQRSSLDDVARAGYEEMEIEMAEMKARTPVDTGALRASGHVRPPEADGRSLVIPLGFGGAAAPYAIPVHENLEAFHKVGEAKFMESVLDEGRPHYAERIAHRVELQRHIR